MDTKPKQRYCKQFYCDAKRDRLCCADCPDKKKCKNPCLNSPKKCGLEDKEYKVRAGTKA